MHPDVRPPLAPMALCITVDDVPVWFGSLAAAARMNRDVRFTPESGHLLSPVDHVARMRRLPSSCGFPGPALSTKCAKSTGSRCVVRFTGT